MVIKTFKISEYRTSNLLCLRIFSKMLEARLTGYALKSQAMQIIFYPTHAHLFHFQISYKIIWHEPINVITENNFSEGFFYLFASRK